MRINRQPRAPRHFGEGIPRTDDNRSSAGHCLYGRQAESLIEGGHDKGGGTVVKRNEFVVRNKPGEGNIVVKPEFLDQHAKFLVAALKAVGLVVSHQHKTRLALLPYDM